MRSHQHRKGAEVDFARRNAPKQPTQNIAAKKRAGQEDVDSDYLFANLPSALVEPLPPLFLLLSYFNLSLSGWTSGVAARILERTCPNPGLTI